MASPPACTWMLVALTLCLTPTGSTSEQCTERPLSSTVTELHYKQGIHATISCLSHPSVKIWLKNGKVYNVGEIKCKLDGDRILLEAAARPAGCSLEEDVNGTLMKVECVALGSIAPAPAPPDVLNVNSTSKLDDGEEVPTWMKIIRYLTLLGVPALLFSLFCMCSDAIFRMLGRGTETVHETNQEGRKDAENAFNNIPAGNDGDPDTHMRLRSLSHHSMGSTDEAEASRTN